jgi:predicted nucleotidyltransferase
MVTAEELCTIGALLEERFGLDTLWLFGSEALATAGPESDVDLAALFRRRPSPLEVLDTAADLAERLGRPIDLVDLDHASPILAMQVLRHGRLLVDRTPRRRHEFFAWTVKMYEDVKILRRGIEAALYARMAHGRP